MEEDTLPSFNFPAVARKKVSAAFDGGMLSSDGGVMLLRNVEKELGIAERLSSCLKDRRDPDLITHTVADMLRPRMFAIAAGYEDANDFARLRHDPIFKMAVGRLPEEGEPLCSQPTLSRLENAPSRIELGRMMRAMIDQFCASYRRAPKSIILDIDDTFDAVHGGQQLSLFNAHYDERCFLPIHIYEGTSGKPVAMIMREGKTPAGAEVRTILKHVIGRIRARWPNVEILVRGDSHYGRAEAMEWWETHGVDYIFGFGGNAVLAAMMRADADALCVERAMRGEEKLRAFAKFRYAAKSWRRERRFVARIEASANGLDIRYIVTSLKGSGKHLYEKIYCARGEMENFIKRTRRSSPPIAPPAAIRAPTSSDLFCTRPPIGSCSHCARPCRRNRRCSAPNSQRSGSLCSKSLRASSRAPRASASPSPPPVRMLSSSDISPADSLPPGPERRGRSPRQARPFNPQRLAESKIESR